MTGPNDPQDPTFTAAIKRPNPLVAATPKPNAASAAAPAKKKQKKTSGKSKTSSAIA